MGLWCPALKNKIIYANGSVQNIAEIPDDLRAIYKYDIRVFFPFISLALHINLPLTCSLYIELRTVWEIKQKTLVDMAADRGCYIDQSQSLNIHMDQPNFGKLTSLHFYAWSRV